MAEGEEADFFHGGQDYGGATLWRGKADVSRLALI
jgi:hypothetical protein